MNISNAKIIEAFKLLFTESSISNKYKMPWLLPDVSGDYFKFRLLPHEETISGDYLRDAEAISTHMQIDSPNGIIPGSVNIIENEKSCEVTVLKNSLDSKKIHNILNTNSAIKQIIDKNAWGGGMAISPKGRILEIAAYEAGLVTLDEMREQDEKNGIYITKTNNNYTLDFRNASPTIVQDFFTEYKKRVAKHQIATLIVNDNEAEAKLADHYQTLLFICNRLGLSKALGQTDETNIKITRDYGTTNTFKIKFPHSVQTQQIEDFVHRLRQVVALTSNKDKQYKILITPIEEQLHIASPGGLPGGSYVSLTGRVTEQFLDGLSLSFMVAPSVNIPGVHVFGAPKALNAEEIGEMVVAMLSTICKHPTNEALKKASELQKAPSPTNATPGL